MLSFHLIKFHKVLRIRGRASGSCDSIATAHLNLSGSMMSSESRKATYSYLLPPGCLCSVAGWATAICLIEIGHSLAD